MNGLVDDKFTETVAIVLVIAVVTASGLFGVLGILLLESGARKGSATAHIFMARTGCCCWVPPLPSPHSRAGTHRVKFSNLLNVQTKANQHE